MDALRNTWILTKARVRLASRNRLFVFFSLLMPMIFLFGFVFFMARGRSTWIAYSLGNVLTLTVMGSFWGLSVQLVTFREQGILRRFRLAPVGAGPMLASSILANYILILPPVAVQVLTCRWFFHMRTWGNLWQALLLITIGSATFAAFGLIVASVTNTMQETQLINQLIWLGFLFLSGATVPVAAFPLWLQRVSLFLPATYLATGLQSAMTQFSTVGEIAMDALALAIGCATAFEISRQLFRWEPETKVPGRAKLWVLTAMIPFVVLGVCENVTGAQLARIRQNFDRLSSHTVNMKMIPQQGGNP